MDLVSTVTTELGVTEERAVQGIGALFVAIRMTTDARSFTRITDAFPDAGTWMQRASFKHGHTGEMLAMVTPGAVRRVLSTAGYGEDQIPQLGAIVGDAVAAHLDDEVLRHLTDTLPLLRSA